MARVGWLHGSLLGVIGASFGLGACFFNASGTCDQNGSCVTGTAGDPAAPDAGGDSSTGEVIPECASDAECDDGNLCTTDACASGSCVATALADGEVAGQVSCQEITCYGGVETREPLAATTLCDGNKVCDGEGNCTGCDAGHPCPDVYECTGEGLCVLPVGSICAGDAECGSGHCVDSVCCAVGCDGVCMSCSSFTGYSTCTYTQAYDNHGDCSEGEACNGAGQCALLEGGTCGSDGQCVSFDCSGGACAP